MSMFNKAIRRARGIGKLYELMGGSRIGFLKISRPSKRVKTPPWMYDDKEIQQFLLRHFPHLADNQRDLQTEHTEDEEYIGIPSPKQTKAQQRQRARASRQRREAGRWSCIIKNFFTGDSSSRDIEEEWDHPAACKCVTRLIQRIRRASEGLRQDGRSPTGRPRGRPRRTPSI